MPAVATAYQLDYSDGSRIWYCPGHRPFWAHLAQSPYLTDEEMREYGFKPPDGALPVAATDRG